jgi:hypothetical protein
MKKIKLEVVVDNEVAEEDLAFLQKLVIHNAREYHLSMEEYGLLPYGPTLGEIENA